MFRSGFKMKMFMVLLLLGVAMLFVSPVCAAEENIGVLVVAHGSDENSWNETVQQAVGEVNLPYPVELGFLEFTEPDIHAAVAALEAQGVDKIIAVPLFISTYSNHIEEIKYVLGLRPDLPEAEEPGGGHPGGGGEEEELTPVETQAEIVLRDTLPEEEELTPVVTRAEIVLTPALDDHVMVAAILAGRLETISQNPEGEIAVLVGHGTSDTEGLQRWTENLASLSGQLKDLINFMDVKYSFVGVGEPTVRDVVSQSVDQGDVLVVPVMLSEGYFTGTKIPNELAGLDYRYPVAGERALLPHPNIARFVELSVNDEALPPLEIKKGDDLCRINYTDVALEEDGKICLCGSFVFHAMQVAFEQLWANDVPRQEDIYVIAYNPSDGTEHALKIIVGDGNYSFDQTIDESLYTTPVLYTYRVTNKATGRSVIIKPGPEVFPENFFSLRARVKNGSATAEEKQEFQNLRSLVEEKLRWQPADEILTYQLVSELTEDNKTVEVDPSVPVAITVSQDVSGAKIKVVVTNNQATLPLVQVQAATSLGTVAVQIPHGTKVTGPPGWDGTIRLPEVSANDSVNINSGNVSAVVEVGYGDEILTFDKAVRLLIPGQAGKKAGYVRNSVFTEITTVCEQDDQNWADANLPEGGDGKIDVGTDLAIWTKHFTKFVSYTRTSSGSSGGGGSSSSRPEVDVYVPAKDATDVAPDAEVSVTFDAMVVAVSDTSLDGITIKDADGNKVGGVKASLSGKKLSLTHDAFTPVVKYTVTIPAGSVKRQETSSSTYHNKEIKWSFTTGKQTVPVEVNPVDVDPKITYFDVPAGHWAASDITKLYQEGIMKGYPDGTFKPENNITRAEFAVLLAKAMGWQSPSTGLDFADAGAIPAWARGSIAAAVEKGAVSGYEDGTFKADRLVNRAEMAVMIMRAMGKQIDPSQPGELSFSDAGAVADWAKGYVNEAVEQGIVKGKPGILFAPGDSATRAEAAAMMARMMVNMGK